tara:strand:- start:2114 stop:3100 length:987 start_codon:yes stop_codon:yes gene_type:complete
MTLILSGTDGLSDVDGTAAAPAIRGTDANTGIFFPAADTIAFAEGGAEAMRIDSSGNVGIGTSSPSQKLDIVGTTPLINIQGGATTNARGIQFNYNGATITGSLINFGGTGETALSGGASGTSGYFLTMKTDGTERARIDSSGTPMFNCTAQLIRSGETFRAQLNAGIASFITSTANYPVIALKNAGTNGYMMAFNNASAEIGTISSSGSNVAYNTSSDYRLKDDIQPMTGALAKVSLLKPVTYKWKADGSNGQGFIAHELDEVVQGCVTGEKDAVETYTDEDGNEATRPVYQGIDTSFLVATLTAAIQEQQALITALTTRITALEAK